MRQSYNFVVVGGGSAGYAGARTAAALGARVAVVDGASQLGGLCILRGCMPSKTLLYSADVLHLARTSGVLGLDIPTARLDMAALQARKRRLIAEFAEDRVRSLESGRFDLFRSRAHFTSPKTIVLDDGTEINADYFLISSGSVVQHPPLPGLDRVHCLTSDDVLNLEAVPPSVIVLGGGVVACELAQFLQRAGSKVILIQRNLRLLREHSPAASRVIEQAFRDEGMEVFTGTNIKDIAPLPGGGARVTFIHGGNPVVREAEAIFQALGRRAATDGLDLAAAGVECNPDGHIRTGTFQRTSNPIIYAAGDCCGPHEIVHVAVLQGETAARHALGAPFDPVNYAHLVKIVFTDPQIATAGLSEIDLQCNGIAHVAASYPFNDHGKSMVMEALRGHVAVFARKPDGLVLGAECVSRDASELIHPLAVGITLGATVLDLLKTHWYHPTLSEIWTYPLEECANALKS